MDIGEVQQITTTSLAHHGNKGLGLWQVSQNDQALQLYVLLSFSQKDENWHQNLDTPGRVIKIG